MKIKGADSGQSTTANVRATAIANSQPAMSIGPMFYHLDAATGDIQWTIGAVPFVIQKSIWEQYFQSKSAVTLYLQTDVQNSSKGQVTSDPGGTNPLFPISGVAQLKLGDGDTVIVNSISGSESVHVGQPLVGPTVQFPATFNLQTVNGAYQLLAYAPIVAPNGNLTNSYQVVGFQALLFTVPASAVEQDPNGPTGVMRISASATGAIPLEFTINPITLASENCSAIPNSQFAADFAAVCGSADYKSFLTNDAPFLSAPTLARSLSLPPPPKFIQDN